ncbi:MAG: DUF3575 domain-containing protein [Candidatus Cryptobacteroides sp.]|jgi:Protein of unknown function (DUF3575).
MKRFLIIVLSVAGFLFSGFSLSAQSVKTNIPYWLTGSPNIGVEIPVTRQLTVNGEAVWLPYMFKKHEEVFRALQGSLELRWYFNPRNFYTNDSWDGLYVGPYAMYGNFNIGFYDGKSMETSRRRRGWGVSGGVTFGYKLPINSRFAVDFNIAFGYTHLQYDKFMLGGEYAEYPIERKQTKYWIGPTKVGISIVYNIFR